MNLKKQPWFDRAYQLSQNGYNNTQIGAMLKVDRRQVGKALSQPEQKPERVINKQSAYNECILVIPDLHAPYQHKDALDFLSDMKRKYKPTRIINMGDELEKNSLNYHDKHPDLLGGGDELKEGKRVIKDLYKIFPQMDIMESNHGSLHIRKAITTGIPLEYLKSYNEVLEVGESWKWHHDLIITLPNGQDCYFTHGKSTRGITLSRNMSMNCVQGHYHSEFNINYWSNPRNLYWSMQVGCLVDDKSLAMAYNKLTLNRPILGCGVIVDSKPILETMPL